MGLNVLLASVEIQFMYTKSKACRVVWHFVYDTYFWGAQVWYVLMRVVAQFCLPPTHLLHRFNEQYLPLHSSHGASLHFADTPFPSSPIPSDRHHRIVWRVRGKIIRSVLCNIVYNNCAQCNAHIWTD